MYSTTKVTILIGRLEITITLHLYYSPSREKLLLYESLSKQGETPALRVTFLAEGELEASALRVTLKLLFQA